MKPSFSPVLHSDNLALKSNRSSFSYKVLAAKGELFVVVRFKASTGELVLGLKSNVLQQGGKIKNASRMLRKSKESLSTCFENKIIIVGQSLCLFVKPEKRQSILTGEQAISQLRKLVETTKISIKSLAKKGMLFTADAYHPDTGLFKLTLNKTDEESKITALKVNRMLFSSYILLADYFEKSKRTRKGISLIVRQEKRQYFSSKEEVYSLLTELLKQKTRIRLQALAMKNQLFFPYSFDDKTGILELKLEPKIAKKFSLKVSLASLCLSTALKKYIGIILKSISRHKDKVIVTFNPSYRDKFLSALEGLEFIISLLRDDPKLPLLSPFTLSQKHDRVDSDPFAHLSQTNPEYSTPYTPPLEPIFSSILPQRRAPSSITLSVEDLISLFNTPTCPPKKGFAHKRFSS